MAVNIPSTLFEWLLGQQGAIFLSTLAAGLFAWWQILASRKNARKKATIDLIAQRAWDQDYLKNRKAFIALRDDTKVGLETWADKSQDASGQQREINNALNDYEIVAIGIKQKMLDEGFYRDWYETQFIKDYERTIGYINCLNDPKNTPHGKKGRYYIEMQRLANKWQSNPRKDA